MSDGFHGERHACHHQRYPGAERCDALVEPPEFIDILTRQRTQWHDAQADLIADHNDLAGCRGERGFEGCELCRVVLAALAVLAVLADAVGIRFIKWTEKIGEPQGQAVDQDAMTMTIGLNDGRSQIPRRFEQMPVRGAACLVMRDARGELMVASGAARRGDVSDGVRCMSGGELFRMRAFAGTRTAQDEGEVGSWHERLKTNERAGESGNGQRSGPTLCRHVIAVALDAVAFRDEYQIRFPAGLEIAFIHHGERGDDDQIAQLGAPRG